jgi:hypothetical protein
MCIFSIVCLRSSAAVISVAVSSLALFGAASFWALPASAQAGLLIEICSSTGDTINVRSGPGTDHLVLASLENGTPLRIISGDASRPEAWLHVRLGDGYQTDHYGFDVNGHVLARLTTQRQCQVLHDPDVAGSPASRVEGRDVTLGAWDDTHDLHLNHWDHPQSQRVLDIGMAAIDAILDAEGLSWDPYPDQADPGGTADADRGSDASVLAQPALPEPTTAEVAARLRAALEAHARPASQGMLTLRIVGGQLEYDHAVNGHFAAVIRRNNGHQVVVAPQGDGFEPLVEAGLFENLSGFALLENGSILQLRTGDRSSALVHVDASGRLLQDIAIPGAGTATRVVPSGDGRVIVAVRTVAGDMEIYLFDGDRLEHQATSHVDAAARTQITPMQQRREAEQGFLVLRRRALAYNVTPKIEYEYYALVNGRVEMVHKLSFADTVGSGVHSVLSANGPWILGIDYRDPKPLVLMSPAGFRVIDAAQSQGADGWGQAVSRNGRLAWIDEDGILVLASNAGAVEDRVEHRYGLMYPFFIGETAVVEVNATNELAVVVDGELEIVGRLPDDIFLRSVEPDRLVFLTTSDAGTFTLNF